MSAKKIQWEQEQSSRNGGTAEYLHVKERNYHSYLTSHTKINSKQITDLNGSAKTIKFSEENTGVNLWDFGLCNGFFMMPKAQITKIKIYTWTSSKLKISASKDTIKTDNSSAGQWLGISAFTVRARFDLWWGNQPKKKRKETSKIQQNKESKKPTECQKRFANYVSDKDISDYISVCPYTEN